MLCNAVRSRVLGPSLRSTACSLVNSDCYAHSRSYWGKPLKTYGTTVETNPEPVVPIHELREVWVKPDKVFDVLNCTEEYIGEKENLGGKLIGYWRTQFGERDRVIQLWEWASYAQRQSIRDALRKNERWQEYNSKVWPMFDRRRSHILNQFDFWPIHYPDHPTSVYELRRYSLKPGQVWVWKTYWQQGLELRKKHIQPVGAWYSEIGDLNTVWHLWQYDSLDERVRLREASWNEPGFSEIVEMTLPLIRDMHSDLLVPAAFSPMQ